MRSVICDGEVIYHDGKFTKVDRDGALRAVHEDLQRALSDDEVERRRLSKALLPHVRHSTRIISILSSMRPFIDTVLGGSGTDLGREQAGVAGVALSS